MTERWVLYAISFIANAAILVFEIAGARLLAPYLGTSVEVWAGTIAVVLGGMAVGYHVGGKIADKHFSKNTIVHFLFGAGAAALFAWGIRDALPTAFAFFGLPLTISALLVGGALFMPTVFLLAILSPIIAKNLINSLDRSAHVVGAINAVGTIGSIVGAVATGLILIPFFGVDVIMLGIPVVLFICAALLGGMGFMKRLWILALVALTAAYLNGLPALSAYAIADRETTYNRIWVQEYRDASGKDARAIAMDPFGIQCSMYRAPDGSIDEETIVFSYQKAFANIADHFYPAVTPERALFLGGCNYSMPRAFLSMYPESVAQVVEIDPGMTQAAIDFFSFDPRRFPTLSIVHEDARTYLNRAEGSYDVIFMDTFGSFSNIPAHLTTEETFIRLSANLAENGVLAVNLIGAVQGSKADFTASLLKTARTVFPYAEVYAMSDRETEVQNLILIASHARALPSLVSGLPYPQTILVQKTASENGLVLKDTYAPVEYLTRYNRDRL